MYIYFKECVAVNRSDTDASRSDIIIRVASLVVLRVCALYARSLVQLIVLLFTVIAEGNHSDLFLHFTSCLLMSVNFM